MFVARKLGDLLTPAEPWSQCGPCDLWNKPHECNSYKIAIYIYIMSHSYWSFPNHNLAMVWGLHIVYKMLCVNRSWIGVVTWCLRVIKCREPGRPFRTLLFSEVLEAIQLLKRAKCFSTIRLSDLFLVTFSYVSSDSHNLLADRIIFFVIVARYCIGHIFLSNPKFQHVWSIMFQCLALFFSLHFL